MSIKGSLLTYENNNHILKKSKNRKTNTSMGKAVLSNLNSSIPSAVLTNSSCANPKQQLNHHFESSPLPAKYMNSKRKHANYSSMYSQIYPDQNNYLHLNSLWSIWYGVLLTLFQGYLAVHGAYRFLGCSLISWKIEPVTELNIQIILSGLVFVLLPFFFTSAVFKVGNLANDGLKLGSAAKERRCSMAPHDGLEEESKGGTLRTLWTHGAPTAAFIHILIAMCLLLPRLLLESRIIENGLLPKETIWMSELDFMRINYRNMIALSVKSAPYQNTTLASQDDEDYFNDTMFSSYSNTNTVKNSNSIIDNQHFIPKTSGNKKYFELYDLVDKIDRDSVNNSNKFIEKLESTTAKQILPVTFKGETTITPYSSYKSNDITTTEFISDKKDVSSYKYVDLEETTRVNFMLNNKKELVKSTPNYFSSANIKTITNHMHHKPIRKHHKQRKILLGHRKNYNQQNGKNQHIATPSSKIKIDHLPNNDKYEESITYSKFEELNIPYEIDGHNGGNIFEHRPISYEESDYGHARVAIYPKSSTTISTTTRDSNIHIVKPEKLPEIIPSTPLSSNSKIIEIKTKPNKKNKRETSLKSESHVEIEPEYLVGDSLLNDSSEYISEINPFESSTISVIQTDVDNDDIVRLGGFAGMLQLFFGVERPIDVNVFSNPPSAEFINLLFSLLVWCVRYPAVFWTTAKSFATIFSVQMIASAADIIFSFVGISNLFKLQIFSEGQPIQNLGLILNASVTLALYLLSVLLLLSSSMVMYLYGHGRLSAKMRDRSIISLKTNESWIYFAHCASLCYVLALSVVKAPLLNDLSTTYRYNLHCPTFMAALVSVMHILLWIIIWLGLTVKRNWDFKLPPLDAFTMIGKATTQPLLMHNRGSLTNTTSASLNNSTNMGISTSSGSDNTEHKINTENSTNLISNTSSTDILNIAPHEDIYWPKPTASSPKLKVTFNEVTSTSDNNDRDRHIGEQEQNDGKRNSLLGTPICFTSTEGEIDDGEYATLRSGFATNVILGSSGDAGICALKSKDKTPTGGIKVLHLCEYDELPPPPFNMLSSMTITTHTATATVNPGSDYVNCPDRSAGKLCSDDNLSEEGKILERVRDDSVTYASTHDLEPPLPPPPQSNTNFPAQQTISVLIRNSNQSPENMQLTSSPEHLISPLAPARVAVQTNEAHIASSSTPRCLRRADSGVPQEALTPRSDTTSCTESTISPPDQAPSESSSGVHSAEEREIEVVIRPRLASKPVVKLPPPAIQEEPYGRCTNMRMSSFAGGLNANSATLPLQRSHVEQKFDYSQHCNTMPLPVNNYNHYEQEPQPCTYATSAHCMSQAPSCNVSSFKTPLYANSGFVTSGHKISQTNDQDQHVRPPIPPPSLVTHTTLTNGARYSNPNILRRHPFNKAPDSLYSPQTFSKIGYESSLVNSTIHEDRDSANYSMVSDQESLYATANPIH